MTTSPNFDQCVRAVEHLASNRLVVAVSGGLDSMVLLHAAIAALGPDRVVAASFDHQLRAESGGDLEFVKRVANELGCRCEVGTEDVRALVNAGKESVEAVARRCRYAFLEEVTRTLGSAVLVTAHHADDQAETVLFNLLRGGGLSAAAGMPEVSETVARPFLGLRWSQLEAAAKEKGVEFREDASNNSADFTRNRIRHEVLPLLNDVMARDVVPAVVRHSEIVAEELQWLDEFTTTRLSSVTAPSPTDGADAIAVRACSEFDQAIRRRVLRAWLMKSGVPDISRRDVLAVEEVMLSVDKPAKVNLGGDRCARRRQGVLFLDVQ